MELTREDAIRLHRQMWTDMRNELGDDPSGEAREGYKICWCRKHGFENIKCDCFLCEYSFGKSPSSCHYCPVKWPTWDRTCCDCILEDGTKLKGDYYRVAPISEILALPGREDV